MAIQKRGSRTIVVNGTKYRWYVRKKASYSQLHSVLHGKSDGTTFAVELAESSGNALLVTLPPAHPSLEPRMGLPIVPIIPSQVAQYISLALGKGWQPTKKGSAFRLDITPEKRVLF